MDEIKDTENQSSTPQSKPTETKKVLTKNEIRNAEDYLYGDRDSAVLRLSHLKAKTKMGEIIPLLKQDLLSYVTYHHTTFIGDIHIKKPIYDLMKNFDNEEFVSRAWKYEPYMLSQDQFDTLQACIKNPIYVKRYAYEKPIYDFENVISFRDKKARAQGERVKTDIQYYLSQKEDILCAKVVNLKYKPRSLKYFDKKRYPDTAEQAEPLIHDKFLYDRSLSISMYVLLDGDPKKAMPFMRYDNDPYPHTNVWIGHDKRKAVFGEVAQSPHFHFQSEEDSLLCLRKFKSNGGKSKYRTGRCNAIDCKHLKTYLTRVDNLGGKLVEKELASNGTYGLPFLKMKQNKQMVKIDVDKMVGDYFASKPQKEVAYINFIKGWLDKTKDFPEYEMKKDKCFGSLIRALDFLDYLTDQINCDLYEDDRKLMGEIEVLVANAVVNGINRNSEDFVSKDNRPKYTIDCNFDRDEEESEND